MIRVEKFEVNPFAENLYLLIGSEGSVIFVDPGIYSEKERELIESYVESNNLTPTFILNTHAHIDHICGVQWLKERYDIAWGLCKAEKAVLELASSSAQMFGFEFGECPAVDLDLCACDNVELDGDLVEFISTPGHSKGGICIYLPDSGELLTGDTLFQGSIGRTDLPTGNYDELMESIVGKILLLDDNTIVYPGHGPSTTIGAERLKNPFIVEYLVGHQCE